MKHLLKLLLVLTILSQSCRPVFAGNAVITILDGQMNPLANENCVLSYFGAPHSMAGGSAVQWRTTATSGVSRATGAFSPSTCSRAWLANWTLI